MSDSPFRRRTLIGLVAIVVVSLVAAIVFAVFGEEITERTSAGSNTFSQSAIGHRGFVQLLRRLDVPVLVSEHDSARVGGSAVLVAAEPLVGTETMVDSLREMMSHSRSSLVVLPKWYGRPGVLDSRWIEEAELMSADEVAEVLKALWIDATVIRQNAPIVTQPDGEEFGDLPTPTLTAPQFVDAAEIVPVLGTPDGATLLGYTVLDDGHQVWILSDPDVLSNHGLGRGDNALLAVAIVDMLRASGDETVVFDETLHGFKKEPSIWRALFEFPLALVTVQALMAVALLLWAANGRFGKPVTPPPVIEPGKEFLIDNTANLLRFGQYAGHALDRYLQTSIREVTRALHGPPDMTAEARRRWLTRVAAARRVGYDIERLEREVAALSEGRRSSEERLVRTAHRIYRWREEMIHGSGNHSIG